MKSKTFIVRIDEELHKALEEVKDKIDVPNLVRQTLEQACRVSVCPTCGQKIKGGKRG